MIVKAQRREEGERAETREQHSWGRQRKRILTSCSERPVPWEPERRESEEGEGCKGHSAGERAGKIDKCPSDLSIGW